jgi:hypothetical protein
MAEGLRVVSDEAPCGRIDLHHPLFRSVISNVARPASPCVECPFEQRWHVRIGVGVGRPAPPEDEMGPITGFKFESVPEIGEWNRPEAPQPGAPMPANSKWPPKSVRI